MTKKNENKNKTEQPQKEQTEKQPRPQKESKRPYTDGYNGYLNSYPYLGH